MKIRLRSRSAKPSWLLPGAAMLALAACSILPPRETPDVYVLPPAAAGAPAAQPLPWQLRVDTPDADGLVADAGIVVMPEPGRITVYANSRWSSPAPVLLRQRLMDAFLDTHALPAVTDEDDSLHADFILSGDLRAFQTEYRNGAPVVVVRYDARLREGGSRDVFAAHSFEVTASPSGTAVPAVVQAFGAASDQLGAQLVQWTLAQAQQDWQKQHATPPAAAAVPSKQDAHRERRHRHR